MAMVQKTVLNLEERTFGVEIEFFATTREAVATAIRNKGVKVAVTGYNHDDSETTWKLTTDSSVTSTGCGNNYRNGNEIVSPILKGAEGFRQLQLVCEALKETGAKVDRTCGVHVHLDANDLTLQNFKNLVVTYARYQEAIDLSLPESRRNGRYCKHFDQYEIDKIMEANCLETITEEYHNDRYKVLNLTAYQRHGTVEFRQHSGSIEYDKISNWVMFCMAMVAESKRAKSVKYKPSTDWMGLMDKLVYEDGLDKSVRTYFAGRRKQFAEKSARRAA